MSAARRDELGNIHSRKPSRIDNLNSDSTALRIAVGAKLRRLREKTGVSSKAAGDCIRGSHAKISRLENGRTAFKERDVRDLLTLYGVHEDEEREEFLELVRQANAPGWWHRYSDVLPTWFQTYIGLEQAAKQLRTYENQFVPGLLQTPEYARAVVSFGRYGDDIDRRVDMRMQRQQVLAGRNPLTLWAILDEAVVHRMVGGRQILRDQIQHLIDMAGLPNVTIQVLRYSAGTPAAAGGAFSILRFPRPELADVVYIEQLTSALYVDREHDLAMYRKIIDDLSVQAESPDRTKKFLADVLAAL
jgi:hypothetical protein